MPAGKLTLNPQLDVQAARHDRAADVHRAARVHVGESPLVVQEGVPRHVHGHVRRQEAHARSTPWRSSSTCTASSRPRCRTTWPAEALKAQAVAARSYALAQRKTTGAVRPLPRHAQPGVRRRRRRGADDDRGRRRDGGPGAHVQRQGRDDVLLLDLGRAHGGDRRRLDGTRRSRTSSRWPTPTTRPRRTTTGGRSRDGAASSPTALKVQGPLLDVADHDQRVAARRHAARDRRERRTGLHAATDVRDALGLRSTWFTRRRARARPAAGDDGRVRDAVHADRPRARARRRRPRAARLAATPAWAPNRSDRARRRRLVLGRASRPPRPAEYRVVDRCRDGDALRRSVAVAPLLTLEGQRRPHEAQGRRQAGAAGHPGADPAGRPWKPLDDASTNDPADALGGDVRRRRRRAASTARASCRATAGPSRLSPKVALQ